MLLIGGCAISDYLTGDASDKSYSLLTEEEDVEDNQRIKVRAYYGERENALIKILEGIFDVILKGIDYVFYGLFLVIIILLVLIVWKRRKKKDEESSKG